jgi:hypothetical protein
VTLQAATAQPESLSDDVRTARLDCCQLGTACQQVVSELEARCAQLSAAVAQSEESAAAAKAAASEALRLQRSAEARLVCGLACTQPTKQHCGSRTVSCTSVEVYTAMATLSDAACLAGYTETFKTLSALTH